ncbi:hypothetical protein BCV72DRAFT_329768, partial [Rhizopus microsporus var. microsporus]
VFPRWKTYLTSSLTVLTSSSSGKQSGNNILIHIFLLQPYLERSSTFSFQYSNNSMIRQRPLSKVMFLLLFDGTIGLWSLITSLLAL